jgi:hypothetical protein
MMGRIAPANGPRPVLGITSLCIASLGGFLMLATIVVGALLGFGEAEPDAPIAPELVLANLLIFLGAAGCLLALLLGVIALARNEPKKVFPVLGIGVGVLSLGTCLLLIIAGLIPEAVEEEPAEGSVIPMEIRQVVA